MTVYGTRKRLRFQAKAAFKAILKAEEHLAKLDAFAEDQSPYINEQLPKIMVMMDGVKQVLTQFRDGL